MPTATPTLRRDGSPSTGADAPHRSPRHQPERSGATLRHRPDIDGLRAVAILLVVGYHAKVPGLSAGFVGVDVFFVLSGFLITRLILDELDTTGTLHLGRFWLRRGRRLLPASALMVSTVLVASQWLDSPLRWKTSITETFAALTYWTNHLFAGRATDYFGDAIDASPLLHTWSLAVEEQFYLLWPVVFLLTARFAGTGSRRSAAIRGTVIAALTVASYALCHQLTAQESPAAFFTALSRAWEFGAGALLAIAAVRIGALRPVTRGALGIAGLLLLVVALATIHDRTPFPGTAALLPVAATAALVAAEPSSRRGLGRLLAARPMQTIGRLSYSWYLWHWPFVIFGSAWLDHDGVLLRVGLSILALVPAELTRRFVENPIRRSPALARSKRASVALLAGITLTGTGLAGAAWWRAERTLDDPLLARLVEARSDYVAVSGACSSMDPVVVMSGCRGGDPSGDGLVLVVGDSHAAHWIPAVDRAAQDLGLRMTASVLGNCPSIDVLWSLQTLRCTERQAGLLDLIDALNPDVVVMSHSAGYPGSLLEDAGTPVAKDRQLETWQEGLATFARHLQARGAGLLNVLDTPRFDENPLECMTRTRSPSDCDAPGAAMRTVLGSFHHAERAALDAAGHGVTFDPFPRLCATRCPVVIDGDVVYNDAHHLTATFSRLLAPDLIPPLQAAAVGSAPPPRSTDGADPLTRDVDEDRVAPFPG